MTVHDYIVANDRSRFEMYFKIDESSPSSGFLDYDVKQISFQFSGSSTGLVVSNAVLDRWDVGAQVLITSHTIDHDGEQVRTITDIRPHNDPQYAILELDSSFIRPTTVQDNPNYAVEVALLSRNIIFEGASDDSNADHGAHLIVFHTPLIQQKLEGVEFVNFGQQGNLGRYVSDYIRSIASHVVSLVLSLNFNLSQTL